jgi:hypothetical protein
LSTAHDFTWSRVPKFQVSRELFARRKIAGDEREKAKTLNCLVMIFLANHLKIMNFVGW